jgi:signal transduction histidine kinase
LGSPKSLTLRLVFSAGLWTILALAIGGLLLSIVFRSYVEKGFDARLSLLLDTLTSEVLIDGNGNLSLQDPLPEPRFNQPYSGWYWQITPTFGQGLRSRSLWDAILVPKPGYTGDDSDHLYYSTGPENEKLRVIERDITLPGSRIALRMSVAASSSEIDQDIKSFNTFVLWSSSALALGLITAVFIQVRFGLGPLRQLRRALGNVRSGRARRLEGTYPREIEPLIKELNALLDHNELVVARARTHVGNLAHALKTPLTIMKNEAAKVDDTHTIEGQLTTMQKHIDYYLRQAQVAARGAVVGVRTDIDPVVEDMVRTLKKMHRDKPLDVETAGETGLVFRGERQDLDEMLGNLLENAFKWAKSAIRVTLGHDESKVTLDVEDDGPGIPAAARAAVFGRGNRIDEAKPGTGLGLSIARDIAEMCGGYIVLEDSPLGGLKARLTLPAAL